MTHSGNEAPLLLTPLNAAHRALGARMVPFAGWDMPLTYEGHLAEHDAVRKSVGIFDVSHMGRVLLTGSDARTFLDDYFPGKISRLQPEKAVYTQLLNDRGGIIDDLIISQIAEEEFLLVINASRKSEDLLVMEKMLSTSGCKARLNDVSEEYAMIALQGPRALVILDEILAGANASPSAPFHIKTLPYQGKSHWISYTGYTGEKGAEILCPAELAEHWWSLLMEKGAKPCGLASRDSLRLEAGYCLYGNDLSEDISPLEASLGWSVDWNKETKHPGIEALYALRKTGVSRRLIGLKSDQRKPFRPGELVMSGDAQAGVVTSGGWSPGAGCGIALALIDKDYWTGSELRILSGRKEIEVTTVKPPFVAIGLNQ